MQAVTSGEALTASVLAQTIVLLKPLMPSQGPLILVSQLSLLLRDSGVHSLTHELIGNL